jgi:hypothetical protein
MTAPCPWRAGWIRIIVLALAVVALLGHLCALPGHAGAHPAGGPHHDAHDEAPSLHGASCQATVTNDAGQALDGAAEAPGSGPELQVEASRAGVRSTRPVERPRPRLFVLHASLLI